MKIYRVIMLSIMILSKNWVVLISGVSMPGDKRYMLKITDLDMEDDRVTFALQNIVKDDSKKMRLPFEKFKDFIYNLQLF
jgi:hypothetical protein